MIVRTVASLPLPLRIATYALIVVMVAFTLYQIVNGVLMYLALRRKDRDKDASR